MGVVRNVREISGTDELRNSSLALLQETVICNHRQRLRHTQIHNQEVKAHRAVSAYAEKIISKILGFGTDRIDGLLSGVESYSFH